MHPRCNKFSARHLCSPYLQHMTATNAAFFIPLPSSCLFLSFAYLINYRAIWKETLYLNLNLDYLLDFKWQIQGSLFKILDMLNACCILCKSPSKPTFTPVFLVVDYLLPRSSPSGPSTPKEITIMIIVTIVLGASTQMNNDTTVLTAVPCTPFAH